MELNNKKFNVKKTFGLGVLMKLTKTSTTGIIIETVGDRFVSNMSLGEIKETVTHLTEAHKIQLKI